MDGGELLRATAEHAAAYLRARDERPVFPQVAPDELHAAFAQALPDEPLDPAAVVAELVAAAEPGIVATTGGRYFGFVTGAALPAAVAADWLTSTWDQNAGVYGGGPAAAVVEEVAGAWLADVLGLPSGVSCAFVSGAQLANFTCLAAARWRVLADAGWDVNRDGLRGAPPLRVLVGEERHVTVDRALRFLGVGTSELTVVRADEEGRLDARALREALGGGTGPTIVCAQAGNVNTGACDPLDEIAAAAADADAWLHVDGAFGLWAAAAPARAQLVRGAQRADSWATDAHKWLNVPYDSGLAFCRDVEAHRAALAASASYLGAERNGMDWTPDASRRARGFAVYAALRSLGRRGVGELVERCCAHAERMAELLAAGGAEILNEVVLNQVLVRFGDDERTRATIARVQADGTCWLGGTRWHGMDAIRISVSSWRTTVDDVERSAAAVLGAARA